MITRFLTISFMALCLISCSSSGYDDPDTPDTPQQSIAFGGNSGTWQDASTSRAAASTGLETLFPSFKVWGYKTTDNTTQTVIDGYTVAHDTDWEYVGINNQTVKYWDYSASDYRFWAYAPADANITTTENSFQIPYTYNPDATATDVPYISYLWYAQKQLSADGYGSTVTLTFAPIIAKVRFRFNYPDGTKSISIRGIRFRDNRFIADPTTADTPLGGTLTATYPKTGIPTANTPSLGLHADYTGQLTLTVPYEDENADIHITPQVAAYNKWYYVPPLADIGYGQGAYTITAHIDGKETTATVPSQYMQWRAGYQYTYIFKITEAGSISFANMNVEQWLTGSNNDNNGTGTEGW